MATVPTLLDIPSAVLTAATKAATVDSEDIVALDSQCLDSKCGLLLSHNDDETIQAYDTCARQSKTYVHSYLPEQPSLPIQVKQVPFRRPTRLCKQCSSAHFGQ